MPCPLYIRCTRKDYIARKRKKDREYFGNTPDGVFVATDLLRQKNKMPWEVIWPKRSQTDPKIIPKWSQNDPKMIPTWCQNDLKIMWKWCKHDLKMMPHRYENEIKMIPTLCENESTIIWKRCQANPNTVPNMMRKWCLKLFENDAKLMYSWYEDDAKIIP